MTGTICTCRHQWGSLFTSDPQLISVIGSVLVVLAFFVIFDGLSVALGGVVRGTGKQAIAAPCTLASYYLLGLPAAAVLAFPLNLGEACCLNVWFMLVHMVFCESRHLHFLAVYQLLAPSLELLQGQEAGMCKRLLSHNTVPTAFTEFRHDFSFVHQRIHIFPQSQARTVQNSSLCEGLFWQSVYYLTCVAVAYITLTALYLFDVQLQQSASMTSSLKD